MRLIAMALFLLPLADAVAKDRGGDFDTCTRRQVEVGRQAAQFKGEARIARLIEADLLRAKKEEAEGDADECLEALDHAGKLLRGEY
jgi:hypothetical protein